MLMRAKFLFAFSGLFAFCLLFSVTKSQCCVDFRGERGGSVNECMWGWGGGGGGYALTCVSIYLIGGGYEQLYF